MDYTIGKLARATGAKVETVRYYERIGLLGAPARSEGNYRLYDAAAIARLSFIRRSRDLGFSLDEVRQLLTLSDDRERSCSAWTNWREPTLTPSTAKLPTCRR